jgi:tetratricopeptide (TPR) repeat protein
LASCVSQSDRFEEDILLFDRLAARAPGDPVPSMFKASTYSYCSDYTRSIAIYRQLLDDYPGIQILQLKAVGALGGLSRRLWDAGDADGAREALEEAALLLREAWPDMIQLLPELPAAPETRGAR